MRKSLRKVAASDLLSDEDANMDEFFDEKGHWAEPPLAWDMPEGALEQKQFLGILQTCMEKLSAKAAQLFLMREVHETDNNEICKELNISATNAWVMLYRARMGLRKCLEINWLSAQQFLSCLVHLLFRN